MQDLLNITCDTVLTVSPTLALCSSFQNAATAVLKPKRRQHAFSLREVPCRITLPEDIENSLLKGNIQSATACAMAEAPVS